MNISEVRVRLVKKDEGKLKAVASITIDNCFVVHDVKILEGSDDFFIAMPSKKTPDGEYRTSFIRLTPKPGKCLKKLFSRSLKKLNLRSPSTSSRSKKYFNILFVSKYRQPENTLPYFKAEKSKELRSPVRSSFLL